MAAISAIFHVSLFAAPEIDQRSLAAWQYCRNLGDLGRTMAAWLAGDIAEQPGYEGSVDVDEDIAPGITAALVAANLAGYVTVQSQGGCDGPDIIGDHWRQRAAVEGYCGPATAAALVSAARDAGLRYQHHHRAPRWRWGRSDVLVTSCNGLPVTRFGAAVPARHIRHPWEGFGVCHPNAVASLVQAHQVTLVDPIPGRNTLLWPLLEQVAASIERTPR